MISKTGCRANLPLMLFVGLLCLAYGQAYAAETLETAIEKQSNYILGKTPAGTVLAIVSIKCTSGMLSEYIMERIPDYIIDNEKNITVVTRSQLDAIQREIDFQYSGEVSDETMVSIGKKTGAQIIVTGSITEAGKVYNFGVQILHVETAQILGSYSVQVVHDDIMAGFMEDSKVAELIMAQAQQKRLEREKAVTITKNVLGFFSNGFYIGYLGSLAKPAGISLGWLSEGASLFLDTAFGPPAFAGYDRSDSLTYHGNSVQNGRSGYNYTNGNDTTAFLWDIMLGLNVNLIKTVLWFDLGGGAQYRQNYALFTETSGKSSQKLWVESDGGGQWNAVVSAGLFVKLWYFYLQGKYKYVIKDEMDFATYGVNHISLGAGIVLRR